MARKKNPHAVALGRKGGRANTPKQRAARKLPRAKGAGRPPVICSTCGLTSREHRWYRGGKYCP